MNQLIQAVRRIFIVLCVGVENFLITKKGSRLTKFATTLSFLILLGGIVALPIHAEDSAIWSSPEDPSFVIEESPTQMQNYFMSIPCERGIIPIELSNGQISQWDENCTTKTQYGEFGWGWFIRFAHDQYWTRVENFQNHATPVILPSAEGFMDSVSAPGGGRYIRYYKTVEGLL